MPISEFLRLYRLHDADVDTNPRLIFVPRYGIAFSNYYRHYSRIGISPLSELFLPEIHLLASNILLYFIRHEIGEVSIKEKVITIIGTPVGYDNNHGEVELTCGLYRINNQPVFQIKIFKG